MKFEQARPQAIKFLQKNSGVTDVTELQAAATHFLHNIGTMPPLLLPAVGKKLLKSLPPSVTPKKRKPKNAVAEDEEPYQPKLLLDFDDILYPPTSKEKEPWGKITSPKDVHVLAGAIKANFLITLDHRHILKSSVQDVFPIPILFPGDFLQQHGFSDKIKSEIPQHSSFKTKEDKRCLRKNFLF